MHSITLVINEVISENWNGTYNLTISIMYTQ